MIQIQCVFQEKKGGFDFQLNNLKREDCTDMEIELASHLEEVIMAILVEVGHTSGAVMKTREVKPKKSGAK